MKRFEFLAIAASPLIASLTSKEKPLKAKKNEPWLFGDGVIYDLQNLPDNTTIEEVVKIYKATGILIVKS